MCVVTPEQGSARRHWLAAPRHASTSPGLADRPWQWCCCYPGWLHRATDEDRADRLHSEVPFSRQFPDQPAGARGARHFLMDGRLSASFDQVHHWPQRTRRLGLAGASQGKTLEVISESGSIAHFGMRVSCDVSNDTGQGGPSRGLVMLEISSRGGPTMPFGWPWPRRRQPAQGATRPGNRVRIEPLGRPA